MRAVFQLPASMTSVVDAPARRQFGREPDPATVRRQARLDAWRGTAPVDDALLAAYLAHVFESGRAPA